MKKRLIITTLILLLILLLTLSLSTTITFGLATRHMGDGFDFQNHGLWEKSDGYSNGGMFNCNWRASNIWFSNGVMAMAIGGDSAYPFYNGGEYKSRGVYGYGYYQCRFKAIKNPGVVTSFFIYQGSPWDEIDVEILGKDTSKVQFNYYTNGAGGHECFYNLGFDASADFHTYAIDWRPNCIRWLVDGKEAYRRYDNIPSHPGRIMMNVWPGRGVDAWLAPYNGATPLFAYYDWVSYDP